MTWPHELTAIFGIRYPIIQAPMLGVSSPAMAAAISEQGGLGSLPVGGLSANNTRMLIRELRQLTGKPFAVNFFAHENAQAEEERVKEMRNFLLDLCERHGLPVEIPESRAMRFFHYREQIDVLLEEKVPIVSFTFGMPDPGAIDRLHKAGTVLIGTATSVEEAVMMEDHHIDVITVQGIGAGGHRGSFANVSSLPMAATIPLLQQAASGTSKPLVAAGGIVHGRAVREAMEAGARGVQVGTIFVASQESLAAPAYQSAILEGPVTGTVLTTAFSGRWARVIPNIFVREVEMNGPAILPYPVQAALTAPIRVAAQQQGNKEFLPLFAGESRARIQSGSSAAIFTRLLRQSEEDEQGTRKPGQEYD